MVRLGAVLGGLLADDPRVFMVEGRSPLVRRPALDFVNTAFAHHALISGIEHLYRCAPGLALQGGAGALLTDADGGSTGFFFAGLGGRDPPDAQTSRTATVTHTDCAVGPGRAPSPRPMRAGLPAAGAAR